MQPSSSQTFLICTYVPTELIQETPSPLHESNQLRVIKVELNLLLALKAEGSQPRHLMPVVSSTIKTQLHDIVLQHSTIKPC